MIPEVPSGGLEPPRSYDQQILSLRRLPFRHNGLQLIINTLHSRFNRLLGVLTTGIDDPRLTTGRHLSQTCGNGRLMVKTWQGIKAARSTSVQR